MGLLLDWDGWDCFFFVVSLALGRSVVGLAWLTQLSLNSRTHFSSFSASASASALPA